MQTQSILNLCIPCLSSSAQSSIQPCDCQASTQIRAVIIHHQSLILFHQFSIENKDFRLFVNIKLRLGIIITVFTLPSNTGPCTTAEQLGLSHLFSNLPMPSKVCTCQVLAESRHFSSDHTVQHQGQFICAH